MIILIRDKKAFNSGLYPTKIDRVRVPAYEIWRHMVQRCWYTNISGNINYIEVEVAPDWLDYSNFYRDVISMQGYGTEFVLDKDILSDEFKIYSKQTCCFVPDEINVALTRSNRTRGDFPIGVDFHKKTGKFRARHRKHLGLFSTKEGAFYAYKESKENYLKELANKWENYIDSRVYQKLVNYTVKISD